MAGPYRFRLRRIAAGSDPVLLEGEPGIDVVSRVLKIGDGSTSWSQLEWFEPMDGTPPADGGASDEAILAHINSLTPHPVYDDGPSLLLLYQNAKV